MIVGVFLAGVILVGGVHRLDRLVDPPVAIVVAAGYVAVVGVIIGSAKGRFWVWTVPAGALLVFAILTGSITSWEALYGALIISAVVSVASIIAAIVALALPARPGSPWTRPIPRRRAGRSAMALLVPSVMTIFIWSNSAAGPLPVDYSGQDLRGADLGGARLIGGDLRYAKLNNASLVRAWGSSADSPSADFTGADLTDADLRFFSCGGCSFDSAQLDSVNLTSALFPGADFRNASLRGATLVDTNLFNTNLKGADLTDANLLNAYFHVDFASYRLIQPDQVADVTWSNTICPDGTNSEAHGMTCVRHLGEAVR